MSITIACRPGRLRRGVAVAAVFAAAGAPWPVAATPLLFDVTFDDPGSAYSSFYGDITRSVNEAGRQWSEALQFAPSARLQVEIGFDPQIGTANGTSSSVVFQQASPLGDIYEMGAATELRTGLDPNGDAPDVRFNLGTNGYLQQELWFAPAHGGSASLIPQDRTDASSVFLHEFGHALGFNGYRDAATGQLSTPYLSSFDALMRQGDDSRWYFVGEQAQSVFGGPVPLTSGNLYHYGNEMLPADEPLGGLMNGVSFLRGTRYEIGGLDLAMLGDLGLRPSAPVPEPGTVLMMLTGLIVLAGVARRRRGLPPAAAREPAA